ncbi:MAG TPA: TonB family protein [Polyangiaceae bacterium]|nr:TonB family protein [Polyangiaceae bacterium]
MSKLVVIGVSAGLHLGMLLALGAVRTEKAASAATPIEIAEVAAPEPPKPPPEPPKAPEPAPPAPRAAPPKAPPAAPRPAPKLAAAPVAAAAPSFDSVPDFGLALDGQGGAGLAVPARAPASAAPPPPVVKQLAAAPRPASSECAEPASKPKPLVVPQPAYTEAARAAGIAGRVRVELTVDEAGHVVVVKVLEGLGYGLDEAALAAARSASFTPAQRCGRAVRATFTIAMRFSAA